MVKGVQRQVIVVQSPDPKLFEQAIFIIRDGQDGISDEALLKEAKKLIGARGRREQSGENSYAVAWAIVGGLFTSILWMLASLL